MVVVIFRSRIKEACSDEYYAKAAEMGRIAESMPGFISYKAYSAEDGERVSIHEWDTAEHLRAWRDHPRHSEVQAYGREHFYRDYTSYVCDNPRESRFVDPTAKESTEDVK